MAARRMAFSFASGIPMWSKSSSVRPANPLGRPEEAARTCGNRWASPREVSHCLRGAFAASTCDSATESEAWYNFFRVLRTLILSFVTAERESDPLFVRTAGGDEVGMGGGVDEDDSVVVE